MNILNLGQIMNTISLHFCIYFIFMKLINFNKHTKQNVIISLTFILVVSICYYFLKLNINHSYALLLSCVLYAVYIKFVINRKLTYSFIITLLSFAISYIFIVLSTFIVSCVSVIFFNVENPNFITYLVLDCLSILLVYLFFKIKKFRNGLYFLHKEEKNEIIGIFGMISSIVIFLGVLATIYATPNTVSLWILTLVAITIISVCMYIWIRKALKTYYENRVKDRTIETLEEELVQMKMELNNAIEENYRVAKENHRINHKIKILQSVASKILSSKNVSDDFRNEMAKELGDFNDELNKLVNEYTYITKSNTVNDLLPKTNILSIDNVIEHMQLEALKDNISFELKINGSINYMIEKFISEDRLVTLLSDHLKDALIAVRNGKNSYKNITVFLGIIKNNYGLCIYDSGIEFKINTLVNLGLKPITTHSDTGGTGFGFMTTFDTLKETNGSLIIKENKPSNNNYTKSVNIIFDNKNEYRITSYRSNRIKKADMEKRIVFK